MQAVRHWLTALLVCAALPMGVARAAPHAAVVALEGPIGPASSAYWLRAQQAAQADGAKLIVLRLDTPGGLDSAMREIIQSILASSLPVACWVGPDGARAASAGTFILYACHVAAMAPASNLGAATPVPAMGGSWPTPPVPGDGKGKSTEKSKEKDKDKNEDKNETDDKAASPAAGGDAMQRKVINDAVAYIRALAARRGRNADWAEAAVRGGESLSANEALERKVIDLIAPDITSLLQRIDGRGVELVDRKVELASAGLELRHVEPNWRDRLLSVLTNPTVAYLLMLVGIYGLLLEGYHPGAILPGVTGGICLLLAAYAFQILPVNYVGLILIALGIALIIAETLSPSFGVLGFGGIVAFVLGSVMLMRNDVPGFGVAVGVIGGIATAAALLLLGVLYLLAASRRRPVTTGAAGMVGLLGEVRETDVAGAWIEVRGERWRARCAAELHPGQRVRVLAMEGLCLNVEAVQSPAKSPEKFPGKST